MHIKQIKDKYLAHNQSLYGLKNIRDSVAMLYQENSKLTPFLDRKQGEKIATFHNPYFAERSVLPFKIYADNNSHSLKPFVELEASDDPIISLISQRRSVRDFNAEYKVSLYELSQLLHYTYGINHTEKLDFSDGVMGFRYVPSGGGLYPLEFYVVILNGQIEAGLYHYSVQQEKLTQLRSGNYLEFLRSNVQAEPYIQIKNAQGVLLTTSIIERQMIKYGERSYRFMMQEVGYTAQMFSLLCERIDFGSCICGMFLDDQLNDFIGIDGVFETVQSVIVFGKKKI